jgi:hypothetical protein
MPSRKFEFFIAPARFRGALLLLSGESRCAEVRTPEYHVSKYSGNGDLGA